MNEDFVPFELAKKLKEKGFREKVNAYYGKWENLFDVHPALDMNDAEYRCSTPTIYQVLKWLRQEKDIHISIDYKCRFGKWYWCAYSMDKAERVEEYSEWIYKDYEEAALAGINYVLDNVI